MILKQKKIFPLKIGIPFRTLTRNSFERIFYPFENNLGMVGHLKARLKVCLSSGWLSSHLCFFLKVNYYSFSFTGVRKHWEPLAE